MSNKFGISPSAIALGSVVAAFAAGAGAGYQYSKKKFEAIADEEIAAFKEEYSARQDAHIRSMELANKNVQEKAKIDTMVDNLQYRSSDGMPEEVTTGSVFDDNPRMPDWDADTEETLRKENSIYILTKEEFFTNQHDFTEIQMTYYEGDDVLCYNTDEVVTNLVEQLGSDCLSKFGYGSQDDDTVYVMNEVLRTIYEITRTDGKYSEVVLGLDAADAGELRHSSSPKKFRSYHDA